MVPPLFLDVLDTWDLEQFPDLVEDTWEEDEVVSVEDSEVDSLVDSLVDIMEELDSEDPSLHLPVKVDTFTFKVYLSLSDGKI